MWSITRSDGFCAENRDIMSDALIVLILASSLAGNVQHFRNAVRIAKLETIYKMSCPTCELKDVGK